MDSAYWIEAPTQPFIVQSTKNFFDEYRLNGERSIGFTGTAGSALEIEEFYVQHGFLTFQHPTYHQNCCIVKPSITIEGQIALFDTISENVMQNQSSQPVLLFVDTPKKAHELEVYLKSKCPHYACQKFDGYEPIKGGESSLIHRAGKDRTITIATQSLARGADFYTDHLDGYLVINTCADITETEYEQMKGRAARNGKKGIFYSILDSTNLVEDFETHRLKIGQQKQQERLKTQFLYDIRHYIVENHFLNLRNSVDVHYQKQWGVGEHFISNKAFLRQLFIFNQEIEKKYYALLKNRVFLTEEEKEIFLTEVAELYNNQLKDILNTQNFALLPVDEPLVPLDNMVELPNINQCKVRDLALLSQLLSSHWQNFGNQQSRMICDAGSQAVDAIEQFSASKNKSEFAEKIINGFLTVQGINADELIKDFDRLGHFFCDSFLPEVKNIPIIGCFIPIESITKTLTEYFTSTKKAILEKKWSQIKRPPIDLLAITSWYNSFNTGFGIVKSTLALAGGPITFILNMILMPVIRKIISYTLQYGKSKTSALPIHLLAGLVSVLT